MMFFEPDENPAECDHMELRSLVPVNVFGDTFELRFFDGPREVRRTWYTTPSPRVF